MTEEFKAFAKEQGTDLVGIGPAERWKDVPAENNPLSIFPEARSIIVVAMRFSRGLLRGIEEGTYWAGYAQNGYGYINKLFMPALLRKMSLYLEDRGWEAPIITHQFPGGWEGGTAGRRVRPGQTAPDVFIDFRHAAFLAGLGEYGYSKTFLTREFGPRQRFGVLLTDAELTPDPIPEPSVCDRCLACVKDCPPGAISATEQVVKEYAGGQVVWGKLDVAKCTYCHHGMFKDASPFIDEDPEWPDIDSDDDNEVYRQAKAISDPIRMKIPYIMNLLGQGNSGGAICGGKGCIRACMIHLEETGRITNTFHNRFRKREAW